MNETPLAKALVLYVFGTLKWYEWTSHYSWDDSIQIHADDPDLGFAKLEVAAYFDSVLDDWLIQISGFLMGNDVSELFTVSDGQQVTLSRRLSRMGYHNPEDLIADMNLDEIPF